MKIEVEKKGKKKSFDLITKWSDVTLEKWLKLIEFEGLSKTEQTIETINLMSDMPKKIIRELGIEDIVVIMKAMTALQKTADSTLNQIVKINDKEYGFHPSLEDMTLGEWADLETFIKAGIDKNMPEIMAVLFRPVVERKNDAYIIEAYDGNIAVRAEEFKQMKASQVQSALPFFFYFVNGLSATLLSYLKELQKRMKQV